MPVASVPLKRWVRSGAPMPAPPILTATPIPGTAVSLSVPVTAGAHQYIFERSADGASGWAQIAIIPSPAYTDSGSLSPNTTYYYRAAVITQGGQSNYSVTASAATLLPPPANLILNVASATEIDATCNAVTAATLYHWERSRDNVGWAEFATSASPSLSITGLAGGAAYYVRVRGTNATSDGERTSGGPATTTAGGLNAVAGLWSGIQADIDAYQDDALTILATANGNSVRAVVDQSANLRNWVQSVSSPTNRIPTLSTSGPGGKKAVNFTGATFLQMLSSGWPAAPSIFLVFRQTTIGGQPTEVITANDANARIQLNLGAQPETLAVFGGVNGGTFDNSIYHVLYIERTSANHITTRLDGAALVTNVSGAQGATGTHLYLGGIGDILANFLHGDIAAAAIYDVPGPLSAGDRATVESYLLSWYGLP